MGLRQWVSRPLQGRRIGVENLIAGRGGLPVCIARSDIHIKPYALRITLLTKL
jgi:hypothetical protein